MKFLLFLFYCLSVMFVYFFNHSLFFLAVFYFLFLYVLKYLFYRFQISNSQLLPVKTLFVLILWTLLFGVLSLPYFYLFGYHKVLFTFVYLIFMVYFGLNGFTILIFEDSFFSSLKRTFNLALKSYSFKTVLVISFVFAVLSTYKMDGEYFWYSLPFILYFATLKYLNLIKK